MLSFIKKKKTTLTSPVKGEVIDITKVPDQVFAEKLVGDGIGIVPTDGNILAPCDGTITKVFKTNHAFTMITKEGIEVLVHLGIDTVDLKGKGFERIINEESEVKRGDLLIKMDIPTILKEGKSPIVIVIITNMDKIENIKKIKEKNCDHNSVVLELKVK